MSETIAPLLGVAAGTRIDTPHGEIFVEGLAAGDMVLAARSVRSIGRIEAIGFSQAELAAAPALRPVCIGAGALGRGRPRRDLLVAPDQPIAVDDGDMTVLVPARLLGNLASIRRAPPDAPVTYIRLVVAVPGCLSAEGVGFRSVDSVPRPTAALPPGIGPGPALARITTALDRAAGQPTAPLRGFADISGTTITGWAIDRADPETPVTLELSLDGIPVTRIEARQPRRDLQNLTGLAGCGFSLPLPQAADRPLAHLTLRRPEDGAELFATLVLLETRPTVASLLARIDRLRVFDPPQAER